MTGLSVTHHLKEDQTLAIRLVMFYRAVSADVLHIATLTFAKVVKDLVVIPEVIIPMRLTRLAGKRND